MRRTTDRAGVLSERMDDLGRQGWRGNEIIVLPAPALPDRTAAITSRDRSRTVSLALRILRLAW